MLVCEKGYIGLGLKDTQIGDHVFVLKGSRVPCILRSVENVRGSNVFKFVGQSYVQGIMEGEAAPGYSASLEMSRSERLRLKMYGGEAPDPDLGKMSWERISLV
jgi:hypothetical protein